MRHVPSDQPVGRNDAVPRVGPGVAAWFGAGCWLVFLLIGLLYFVFGSDLFGYLVGLLCIGLAIYFIRRELRWASVRQGQLVVRGLLYSREYALDDDVRWATSPVRSGLPLHTIDVVSRGELLVRLESQRYPSEAKAASVAIQLFPHTARWEQGN